MFVAVMLTCLAQAPDTCRDVVLPASEMASQEVCLATLEHVVPAWLDRHPGLVAQPAECRDAGSLDALTTQEIAPDVHVHLGEAGQIAGENRGRIANLSFIIGDTVGVIDAGASRAEGEALYLAIRRLTDKPISHLILTHMHPDHALGAEVFAEAGATIVGHAHLAQSLNMRAETYLSNLDRIVGGQEMIGTNVVAPDEAAEDELGLDLGGRQVTLFPVATAHTDNDLMVYDASSGVLFTGDLLFRELTPVVDGSLNGWLDWLAVQPTLGQTLIVPGHGPVADDWAVAVAPQAEFLRTLRDETRKAIDAGMPMSNAVPSILQALQPLAGGWTAFDENTARDATAAYKELEWE